MSPNTNHDKSSDAALWHLPERCVEALDAASWEHQDAEYLLRSKLQAFADEIIALERLRDTF